MLPNFIGIGAPKAGTTWLFRCLKEHPDVFVAAVKETNFFHYESIEGRMREYEEYFGRAAGAIAVGEISVRYLHSPRAAERIKTYIPHARLFVSLRNPIEQVYSYYWHLRRQNFHENDRRNVPQTFEEALERYKERLLDPGYCYKPVLRWLQLFDRSHLLIILFDDIVSRPDCVVATLYSFLNVDNSFKPRSMNETGLSVRSGTSPKSPFHGRIHSALYGYLARRVYHRLKLSLGVRRAARIKDSLRLRELMEYLFQQKGYPPMHLDTRAFLRGCFAEDIHNLAELTGRDLSHWR